MSNWQHSDQAAGVLDVIGDGSPPVPEVCLLLGGKDDAADRQMAALFAERHGEAFGIRQGDLHALLALLDRPRPLIAVFSPTAAYKRDPLLTLVETTFAAALYRMSGVI